MNVPKLVIWSVVLFILISLLISLTINGGAISIFRIHTSKDYKIVYEEEFSIENIENINLNLRSGNANIYSHNGENVKVIQKSCEDLKDEQKVQVSQNNNTLEIKEGKAIIYFFSFVTRENTIDIYLPQKTYDEIYLKCTNGKIIANSIECNELKSKLSSGKMELTNIIAENIELNTTSGKIALDNIESNKLTSKMSSGSIELTDITTNNAELSVTSGKVLVNNMKTNELRSDVSSGKIEIIGEIKNLTLKCTSGNIVLDDSVLPDSLSASTTSGKINVTIPENDGFEAQVKVTSGKFDTQFDIYSNVNTSSKHSIYKYKDGGNVFSFNITSGKVNLNKR